MTAANPPYTGPELVQRRRLARALAAFCAGGIGPSHATLTSLFDDVGLDLSELGGSKSARLESAIASVRETELWTLVELFLDAVQDNIGSEYYLTEPELTTRTHRLRKALVPYGRELDEGMRLRPTIAPAINEASQLRSVPVLREHIDRLHRSAASDDVAAVVGSAKELVESTVKFVLQETGHPFDRKDELPRLAKQAQMALKLHVTQHSGLEGPIGELTKRVLSALTSIATSIGDFRNLGGTGHGRVAPVLAISRRHAKLVAGAAMAYSEMLLDTLQDPDAPWREPERGA